MSPDSRTAMGILIAQIREAIPTRAPGALACTGACAGCSVKLLEYLETELVCWESRLAAGERPGLADLSQLAGTARKIHRVLVRNGLALPGAGAQAPVGTPEQDRPTDRETERP